MNNPTKSDTCAQRHCNLLYVLAGFGAGAIAGATAAILLAPASGSETTAAIKEKWGDISEKAGEAYSDAKEAVSTAYEKTAAVAGKAKDRLSRKPDEQQEEN